MFCSGIVEIKYHFNIFSAYISMNIRFLFFLTFIFTWKADIFHGRT